MPATISFFDMSVSITPPSGYLEPVPLTLGPNWQSNDVRLLFVSGAEAASNGISEAMKMNPDPPTGFVGAYVLNSGFKTRGVYYRYLAPGDADTSVAWVKPSSWQHFVFAPLTIRGVNPGAAPTGGALTMTHNVPDSHITVSPVTVPSAGQLVICMWTVADPEGIWPSWATALGVPTDWTHLVATDKSGTNFYQYSTDPAVAVVGKSFAAAGSTGSISVPCNPGSHAFAGMYAFIQAAPDVSATIGAA